MTKHVVKLEDGSLILMQTKGFTPKGAVGILPEGEEIDWMIWGDYTDPETSEVYKKAIVDETLKASILAQRTADAAQKVKDDQVSDKYVTLTSEVTAEAQVKMYALSLDSAIANYLELVMMKNNPSKFAAAGLLAEVEVKASDDSLLFSKGDALDTDVKVTDYATRLIEIAEDYAIYRHQKKDTFRADKAAILGA